MRGLFVTGTDTGVGKTTISAGVTLALRSHGRDVGVMKPVQSGALAAATDSDALALQHLTDSAESPSEIAPFCFRAPLAPLVAGELEARSLTLAECLAAVAGFATRHDLTVVEGAGGLLVPVGPNWTIADLARGLALPVLVVGRATLGTVNHVALTVRELRRSGLEVTGVVLNGPRDHSSPTNRRLVEAVAETRVFGELPHIHGILSAARLLDAMQKHVDVAALDALVVRSKETAGA